MTIHALHGGASFSAIGTDCSDLSMSNSVVCADVLDAWFDPSPKVLKKIAAFLPFILRASPPSRAEGVRAAISHARGIPIDHIVLGAGSSSLMYTFFTNFLTKKDTTLILDPTYSEYKHIFTNVIRTHSVSHALNLHNNFVASIDDISKSITKHAPSLVALVNPNNPTGQLIPRSDVLTLVKKHPSVTFFIDEAYIDYADAQQSLERDVPTHSNLVVLKSMSKVYALSGARIAYLVAPQQTVAKLESLTPPWSISLPAQVAAIEALKSKTYYERMYKRTRVLRTRVARRLQALGFKVFPSQTNVLIAKVPTGTSAAEIVHTLQSKNVFIRNCDPMGTCFADNCIRVAVRSERDNTIVLSALKEAVSKTKRAPSS